VPDGSLEDTCECLLEQGKHWQIPVQPIGILRINDWMEKKGYSGDIYDINSLRPSDEELIKNFKRTKPTVVGLSAPFSWCYPNVKRISKILRDIFPDIWIVVGGHLTGSSNVVLRKTETDICVVGDGEIPFVELLDYFKLHPTRHQLDYAGLCQIKGLAFIDKNNKLKVTGNAEQLPASEMHYPAMDKHRLGLQKFGGNGELIHEFFRTINDLSDLNIFLGGTGKMPSIGLKGTKKEGLIFFEKNRYKKIARIFTSKGCVSRCTFCQRASKGYRVYATNYFENYIIELKEKYNVRGLYIDDENFGSDRKHSYELARIMKKHDIYWYIVGARVKSVTYEDLKFYKEHNMIAIRFGVESGSQQILDIMEKKITTKDVFDAYSNCKKVGVNTATDAFLIGMVGETEETVKESAELTASLLFLLEKDWNITDPAWTMAIPGTPLYEYCQQIGVIGKTLDEEEDYLIRLSELNTKNILNYLNKTDSNTKEVHYWLYLYHYAAKKEYVNLIIKNNKSIKSRLLQIYQQCIKGTFDDLIANFKQRKNYYKNKKLFQKTKWYAILSINFLLPLSVLFLPKAVLFPIIRVYANLRFYLLEKNNKVKKGKQKYNFFSDQPIETVSNLKLTGNRIAKTNKQIDLSLRRIVMDNRRQLKPAITDEEKSLQILAQGQ
jgi:radical SAM superfamily enzyme YgiQ (UPF0313 family)